MGEYIIKVSASDYASAVTFADYYDLYYLIELNRISEFRFIAFGLSAAQKAVLIEGNTVYILYDSTLVLKGEIRKADIDDELEEYHIEGNGMAVTLLDRDVRGRNQWDDTEADTIVKSLISGIMTEGTIEAAIKVGFRAEEDSVLRGGVSLTKAIDWDWYVDQDVTFNTDRFNFVANKGAITSQETFILGDDIFRIQRSKDVDNVFNVVRVLGYGDGVNQIMSESFYATTNRATLSAAITAAAASLTVTEDISSFPASGNLRCGREWIVYSAKNDGTKTFTISARGNIPGANPPSDNPYYIAAYAHKKGAEIFDLQYSDAGFATKATAQAGTSIKTYGLRDNLYPDQAIRNQSTVDLLAQRLVNKYNIPIERIELSTAEEVLTAAIGDIVSIEERDDYTITGINQGTKTFTIAGDYASEFTDTYDAFRVSGSTGNDGRYTIVSGTFDTDHTDIVVSEAIPDATVDGTINPHVEYRLLKEEFNYEDYSMSLILGNAQDFFLEAFGELKKKMDINSVYGLGNTVAFSLPSFAQNIEKTAADNFYSYMQFKIPKNCKAVNITDLFWYLDNFRAPSKITAGGSAHSHTITGQATAAGSAHTHSITGKATSGGAAHSHGFGAAETTQAADAAFVTGALISIATYGEYAGKDHYHQLPAHSHYIHIHDCVGDPDYPIGLESGDAYNLYCDWGVGASFVATEDKAAFNTGAVVLPATYTVAGYLPTNLVGAENLTKQTHTHKLQGATTVDESTHTHPITGIATDSESAHTHTITGQATDSESAHTHAIGYGIQEEAAPANIIAVDIKIGAGGWNALPDSPYTGDKSEVDIRDVVGQNISGGEIIQIRFLPNTAGRCWIRGGGDFQGFIESK